MNSIFAIHPYKKNQIWAFDDPSVALKAEPFVLDTNLIIDHLVRNIPNAEAGFTMYFSPLEFPDYDKHLERIDNLSPRENMNGTWYHDTQTGLDGWLCPALFLYFPEAPKHIYAKAVRG